MQKQKGIDVSDNQGLIDWRKVHTAGVQFAILRSVRGSGKADYQFVNNVTGCLTNGIPWDAYKYTYADTVEKARAEAAQVVVLLESVGAAKSTTVWWDVEDRSTLSVLGVTVLTMIIRAAREVIESAGYQFGIYLGLYVYKEHWFDIDQFADVSLWVARYPSSGEKDLSYNPPEQYKPDVGREIEGWQYTSNGMVDGISTAVDLDIRYRDIEADQRESGVIYTVSVADVWTQTEAETVQKQLAARGIIGVVHKCKIIG